MSRQNRPPAPTKLQIAKAAGESIACFVCGADEIVERAHVIAYSLGGTNEPGNFALLCPAHHEDAPDVGERSYFDAWLERSRKDPLNVTQAGFALTEALARNEAESDGITSRTWLEVMTAYLVDELGSDEFGDRLDQALRAARAKLGGVATHSGRMSHETRVLVLQEALKDLNGLVSDRLAPTA